MVFLRDLLSFWDRIRAERSGMQAMSVNLKTSLARALPASLLIFFLPARNSLRLRQPSYGREKHEKDAENASEREVFRFTEWLLTRTRCYCRILFVLHTWDVAVLACSGP